MSRARGQVPSALAKKFDELVKNLPLVVGTGALFIGAQFTPFGWLADLIGVAWIGVDSAATLADLVGAIEDARNAVNNAQIDSAASRIAQDFTELAQNLALAGGGHGIRKGARWLKDKLPEAPKVPGGIKAILDSLPGKTGKTGPIKEVPDAKTLSELFDRLAVGGRSVNSGTYPGVVVELPDGTIIRMRAASKSGGATLDITLPSGTSLKVHIKK